eukprot:6206780-Pleurochrysis_carterae.AAC.3
MSVLENIYRRATLSPFGLAVMNPAGSALLGDVVLAARSCRAFYSHRWYCPETKEPHPDNADNAKLKQLQMLLRGPQSDVEFICMQSTMLTCIRFIAAQESLSLATLSSCRILLPDDVSGSTTGPFRSRTPPHNPT